MLNKDFSKLCTPARLYFVIAIISSVVALLNKVTLLAVFFKLVFAFIWTYILGWLCKKGYDSLSWFLVLFPFIVKSSHIKSSGINDILFFPPINNLLHFVL